MGWLRRRRQAALREAGLEPRLAWLLREHLPRYADLDDARRRRLEGDVAVFLHEKAFVGCAGLVVDDVVRVVIAGEACVLLLGFDDDVDVFPGVTEVLVYPSAWQAMQSAPLGGGLRVEEEVARDGEAWRDGQILVAWDHVTADLADVDGGHDVVLHEFAHALDHQDGVGDGTPVLPTRGRVAAWARVLGEAYADLQRDVALGHPQVLRAYGATNPAEFFAVATEVFFGRPTDLAAEHPALYAQLSAFYRQDPAGFGSAFQPDP